MRRSRYHNVGGLPAHMRMKLVEPLRELFKDEVRRIGVELGLPAEMCTGIFAARGSQLPSHEMLLT